MEQVTCKSCGFPINDNFYFCPNCGKKIKEAPLPTGAMKQLGIYALSFLLPPLGLVPAFKYLKQKETKARLVGVVAIVLTVISIILTLQLTLSVLGATSGLGGNTSQQLQDFQNLGY